MTIMFHPNRFPKHDEDGKGDKGQKWQGTCNTSLCDIPGAIYFNVHSKAYYCDQCANKFRRDNLRFKQPESIYRTDHPLTIEEMDKLTKL